MREPGMQLASCEDDGSSRRCTVSKSSVALWARCLCGAAEALAVAVSARAATVATPALARRCMVVGSFRWWGVGTVIPTRTVPAPDYRRATAPLQRLLQLREDGRGVGARVRAV